MAVNPRETVVQRFIDNASPADRARMETAAFLETLCPMIPSDQVSKLPAEFFDLRRSARIIGREDGFSKDRAEEEGLKIILRKPVRLLKAFEIKARTSKEKNTDADLGEAADDDADEEPEFIKDTDADVKAQVQADAPEAERISAKQETAAKPAASSTRVNSKAAKAAREEREAKTAAAFAAIEVDMSVGDGAAPDAEPRDITEAELYASIARHMKMKQRIPGSASGYAGLPKNSFSWASHVTKMEAIYGSVPLFVADYEFRHPELKPLPITAVSTNIEAKVVFNAVVAGLNKDGRIPGIIVERKHSTADIDESFLRASVKGVENFIPEGSPRPTSVAQFALAANLVKQEDGKFVPNTAHELLKNAPKPQVV